jgi:glucose/arabinose dehydrogenase
MRKTLIVFIFVIKIFSLHCQTYTVDNLITNLNKPIAFDFMPNGNVIITEQEGIVKVFNSSWQQVSQFWNFHDSSFFSGEMGTLGVTLDPNFNSNHYIYVYWVKGNANEFYFKVTRFTESNNIGTNPVEIFTHHNAPGSGNAHAAGNLHFRSDGKLYITVGTIQTYCSAQALTCPRGKILRINSDGTCPTSNPFYDDGNPFTGNDDRIWAYGLRNPFDFCFSPINDSIYCTENGGGDIDEINQLRKGKNYAFPVCDGYCYNPLYVDPVGTSVRPEVGLSAILIYNGSQMPELNGKLLFVSSNTSKIFKCDLGHPPIYDTIISRSVLLTLTNIPVITMKQGIDGNIYCTAFLSYFIRIGHPIGISGNSTAYSFSLEQNYPNPFNNKSKIKYEISNSSNVKLTVYDVFGRKVKTLVNEKQEPGAYEVQWDATEYSSGLYIYMLTGGEFEETKKMILLK